MMMIKDDTETTDQFTTVIELGTKAAPCNKIIIIKLDQHFLLFLLCLQKVPFTGSLKLGLCGKGLNTLG